LKPTGQLLTVALLVVAVAAIRPSVPRSAAPSLHPQLPPLSAGVEDDANARDEYEFRALRDPRTNAIPFGIRRSERMFARTLPSGRARRFARGQAQLFQDLVWTERGPNNIGGRTRAFAIDAANPTRLIAGSVAGGIWRSTDDGATWDLRTAPGQIHGTSCIAQDTRAGKTNTWYVGTGEIRGSTTNATRWGSLYLGDGIFKSTNGGLSWTLLPSTATGTPQSTDPFDYVINIATNRANAAQDEVLAATFRGIYRSVDGGVSWTQVLASDSAFTDVAITPTGTMYAVTRTGLLSRVWRSTNGVNWNVITPASFPATINRAVVGLAPSNDASAYFFLQGHLTGPNGHELWKYTYLSGDGSGAGGTWENRSANLPPGINTQAAYDQTIHVKPDDANFVLIGGTDLYRSTNGFATAAATTVIGGYPFFPDGLHHPDLQGGAFSPANPNVYYSANDGGVQKALDITLPNMVWTSLNNGYNVTQLYSVAIPPDAGSNLILAGAQDNGSRLGTAPGASAWGLAFGGDGTVVEVSPASQDRLYTQFQNGFMQRMRWDTSEWADITPEFATNRLFVNPIVLDPNSPQLLYYAGGGPNAVSGIWRNNNAPVADTLTGWTDLIGTNVFDGAGYQRRISALGISTANSANVLYFGTTDGVVKRASGVHTGGSPAVAHVPPPAPNVGTVNGGFVRCIAVDPTNSNNALVVYGNYNYPSLWYTTNGGASWTDVEGNLAGATGPSIRWATMFYYDGQLQVFLGTSIGVLSTNALAGGATVWSQEAEVEIGNVLIAWMDYRPSDHTLAVATHGRGVFTTRFLPFTSAEPGPSRISLGQNHPNPAAGPTTIAFELPRAGEVSLRLYDVAGREVAVLAKGARGPGRHLVSVAAQRLAPGSYHYVLRALGVVERRRLVVRR
jgi:hypothetical protein